MHARHVPRSGSRKRLVQRVGGVTTAVLMTVRSTARAAVRQPCHNIRLMRGTLRRTECFVSGCACTPQVRSSVHATCTDAAIGTVDRARYFRHWESHPRRMIRGALEFICGHTDLRMRDDFNVVANHASNVECAFLNACAGAAPNAVNTRQRIRNNRASTYIRDASTEFGCLACAATSGGAHATEVYICATMLGYALDLG